MDDREWTEACRKLMKAQNKGIQIEEMNKRSEDTALIMPFVKWAVGTSHRALREYSRRYDRALRAGRMEEEANKEIEAESRERRWKMREEMRELTRERDSLRESLAAKEEERGKEGERERRIPTPPLDVEMRETEMREIEMRESATSPTPCEAMTPAILGALEEWLERKLEQMGMHRPPPPLRRKGKDRRRPAVGPIRGPRRSDEGPKRGLPR